MSGKNHTIVKNFKYHGVKVINLKCSIWFLSACLHLGFTPRGLQPKFPLTGLPFEVRDTVNQFSLKTSFELTNLVLISYKPLLNYHYNMLTSLYFQIINNHQNNIHSEVNASITSLHRILTKKSKTLIKKLTNLYNVHSRANVFNSFFYRFKPVHSLIPPPPRSIFEFTDIFHEANPSTYILTMPHLSYYYYHNQNYNNMYSQVFPANYFCIPTGCRTQTREIHTPNNSLITISNASTDNPDINTFHTNNQPNLQVLPISNNITKKEENKNSTISIENLSTYIPNKHETSVLEKGLTFAPTPKFDHLKLVTDALNFSRKIKLKHHFNQLKNGTNSKKDIIPTSIKKFEEKSTWDLPPLPQNHPIEQFTTLILNNISDSNFSDSLKPSNNLTKEEYRAIKTLKENQDIMILPADKGNTLVILDTSDYISEAKKQLSDCSTYEKLNEEPTSNYNNKIQNYLEIQGPKENLSAKAISLLTPKFPRTPIFYTLPKIHKSKRPPPGRPIVSSFGCPTERISSYVDGVLQPHVKDLPSYVKDTDHFLTKIKEINDYPLPENLLLASIDVESLYTNIPHKEGIKACEHFLNLRSPNSKPSTNFITTLISMILTMNNFKFQDQNYLQVKGTAMGTRMAPSFANLFMGLLEESFLITQNLKPFKWFRFIDDIFLIWQHGRESLLTFLNNLNSFSCLNFTWKISEEIITFLDVDVILKNKFIKTNIHVKDSNKMQYLHYTSCHPMHVKRSIPKSLSIRAQNLCSDQVDFNNYLRKLSTALCERDYPQKLVQNQFKRPKNNLPIANDNDPKFITKYFPGLNKINRILKIAYPILESNPETRNLFSKPPRVIFSQPPNLQNILSRPKFNFTESKFSECKPCDTPRCATCKILQPSTTFVSSSTGKTYPIRGNINCNSSNVIYQLTCKNCPKDYIGKTSTPLRFRMSNHRFDVVHQNSKRPLSSHAIKHNIKSLEEGFILKGIYKEEPRHVEPNQTNFKLCNVETAHQLILKTRQPDGLNIR